MRRICEIVLFSTPWFILPTNLSFCQSPGHFTHARSASFYTEAERIPWSEPERGMEIMRDGYPGDIFTREDPWDYTPPTKTANRNSKAAGGHYMPDSMLLTQAIARKMPGGDPVEPSKEEETGEEVFDPFETAKGEEVAETIADPLEPINRAFFNFNDRLYFWLLKPVSIGYRAIFPEPFRVSVKNFFYNLGFPIRFVNCLFQAKFELAGQELTRFLINSTVGLAGFLDPAKKWDIKGQEEDLGQSLGAYGMGPAFYINWPILGPSSLRDTFGLVGDGFLYPVNYLSKTKYVVAVRSYEVVNETSLTIGDYEDLKRASLDPYIAVRDAYFQYRKNKTKE